MIGYNYGRVYSVKIYKNYQEDKGDSINQITQTLWEYKNDNSGIIIMADITRKNFSALGTAIFTINNISKTSIGNLYYDNWNTSDRSEWRYIEFYAGYKNGNQQLQLLFHGLCKMITPTRNEAGNSLRIQADECGAGIIDAEADISFNEGTSYLDICKYLCKQYTNSLARYTIDLTIEKAQETLLKSKTFKGKVLTLLGEHFGKEHDIYVENLNLAVKAKNKSNTKPPLVVDKNIIHINQPPTREGSRIKVETIFIPSIQIGDLIDLQSNYVKTYNGIQKIVGIHHLFTNGDGAVNTTLFFEYGIV